jgi:hypothetical protein
LPRRQRQRRRAPKWVLSRTLNGRS